MKKRLVLLLLLLPLLCMAQDDDPNSHRGVQYATTGTDFWVCFPRTTRGMCRNASRLYVVCERDCDVTVENEWLGYSQTYHVMRRRFCDPDTNYIFIPMQYTWIADTVPYVFLPGYEPNPPFEGIAVPRYDYTGTIGDLPQPRGFHVTSTDTVALFIYVSSTHYTGCCVLPTEMLRDEYVALPPVASRHQLGLILPSRHPHLATIDIVAVDDSTTVDIVLSDWDWLNRRPGDTLTVMLRRGQLYHLAAGEVQDKYYPRLSPYHYVVAGDGLLEDPTAIPVTMSRHKFSGGEEVRDTFAVDLAGTRIRARDCKRIAVFEGCGIGGSGLRGVIEPTVKLEQSVPITFAEKEYLVPNWEYSRYYIRFTGLEDNTIVGIRDLADASHYVMLSVDEGETNWWETDTNEGPYYITSNKPLLVKWIGYDLCTPTPTRWWHGGRIAFGTMTDVDENGNLRTMRHYLHILVRTEDVESMWMDEYHISSYFQALVGSHYSYAHFNNYSQFCSTGTHVIESRTNAPFVAYTVGLGLGGETESHVVTLPHHQPKGRWLTVNGMPADSLKSDSIWCLYDPVTFHAWNQRPCDSLIWDFGDGTVRRFSYTDEGFSQPQVYTWQDTGHYAVQAIFKYEDEGCFTIKPDTLTAHLWFHNHYDSTFSVRLCEGSFTFRGQVFDYTDTHYVTTYWTESGCDTLWKIDFVTCPHCHWVYDTVALEDMPIVFNEITFGSELHDEPIHLHIGDSCDSIIYYTLIVIPHWGEKPIDSTFILAPNVITPTLETNNIFSLYCSPHILKAEVSIYDRHGVRMAQFDGLTGYWDGTSEGHPCQQGTYVYYIRYIDTADKGWKTHTGTVTLLR